LKGLVSKASTLVLHGNTPVASAWGTPLSMADDFLGSAPFEGYIKEREDQAKVTSALFARIDNVAKAVSGLASSLGRQRRR
jgi:hypothetical protein